MFRRRSGQLEVFLAHPGRPYFSRKDDGVWTIPKGEVADNEDLLVHKRKLGSDIGQRALTFKRPESEVHRSNSDLDSNNPQNRMAQVQAGDVNSAEYTD